MDIDSSAASEHDRDAHDVPQAVSDEELFEAYLSARLGQALDTLNRARNELAAQPHDFNRALVVMRRVHELRDLQAQLETQRDRVNTARTAAGLDAATGNPHPVVQATPGEAFRAAQAEQADKVMAAITARPKTCPSCQALLEPNRQQCGCGYTIEDTAASDLGTPAQDAAPFSAP
ncbi:MAG TPA: hypothetical protein VI565_04820 [Burkholderiales bacterium]|jgi:hypothetical protein|nr:hypothetical protein [Burkholderiales bacterium]